MTYASGHFRYRPLPTRTVYNSTLFRKPEVQQAFEKVDQLPDEPVREAARHGLIALVSMVGEIKQNIDDLGASVARLEQTVEKEIAAHNHDA